MALNPLAAGIAGAGKRAIDRLQQRRGTMNDVHATAIQVAGKLEHQKATNEHAHEFLDHIHRLAGAGKVNVHHTAEGGTAYTYSHPGSEDATPKRDKTGKRVTTGDAYEAAKDKVNAEAAPEAPKAPKSPKAPAAKEPVKPVEIKTIGSVTDAMAAKAPKSSPAKPKAPAAKPKSPKAPGAEAIPVKK